MSANHDSSFVKSFLGVLGGLVAITLVIAFAVHFLGAMQVDPKDAATAEKKVEARLAPIGVEITDPSLLVKVSAAPHVAMSGEQIVSSVCSACHGAGVLGAPKIGDKAAWGARKSADGGVDGLAASAIKGKNSMPPRGGNPDLTDDEIKSAVEQMLKLTGA